MIIGGKRVKGKGRKRASVKYVEKDRVNGKAEWLRMR